MVAPAARGWRRAVRLLGGLLVTASVLAGCTGSTTGAGPAPGPEGRATPAAPTRYVALGDSFTAAPLVPTTDLAGGCFRSDGNYPSLVSSRLHARRLVDVSCSGADTDDVRHPQVTFGGARVAPQLRAVTPATDLVTVGLGGNDFGLYGSLVGFTGGAPDPTAAAARQTATIGARVAGVLRAVRGRAPGAAVLLVGYPRVVEEGSRCPRRLPLDAGQIAAVYRVQLRLDQALRRAAAEAGATYVDVFGASEGHDVCSADPWVNGQVTDRRAAAAYHPLPAGMRAVADLVVDALAAS